MPDNGMFVVKYFEIVGSDPARIVAACDTLGIRATELGPAVALPAATSAPAAAPPKRDTMPPKESPEDEPPRRRGRPPKARDDSPESESPKPRRGRPPKSASAEDDAPRPRRGRPPKNRDDDPPPKRRSAEPPPDDDAGEDGDADDAPVRYDDVVSHLKSQDPRRIGDIVEELYLEFGWINSRDVAQVLKSVRADTKLSSHDFWAVLERICPDGEEDDWLNLLDDKIKPHLEDAIGAADDAGNG